MNFADCLMERVTRVGNPVLVGLDPRVESLPPAVAPTDSDPQSVADSYEQFCCGVVDVVAPLVSSVKPQAAFFEQVGPEGGAALARVIEYARSKDLLVILDGKRNDIGSTATAYADGYLGAESAWRADALTVSPYLGEDSLVPFFDTAHQRDAGIFVLVKTSNPGGGMFQDRKSDGEFLFEAVADFVELWAQKTKGECGYGAIGAVAGATYPEQLAELRQRMPHTMLLVPGFGAQGGRASDVQAAMDSAGRGAIVNSSRGIIFAHSRPEFERFGNNWQAAVEAATLEMAQQLTPA